MDLPVLTTAQEKRDAYGSIRGYLYQFEMSVLEILKSSVETIVRIEGVEDLDKLDSGKFTAIQVKYWESKKNFTNKAISEPLFAMFESFLENQSLTFQLYVHFSNSDSVKRSLTKEDVEESFTADAVAAKVKKEDSQFFEDFSRMVTIIPGPRFEDQRVQLVETIAKILKCSSQEALELHLPMAVYHINRIACNSDEKERVITRQDLINMIDVKEFYYFKWQSAYVTQEKLIIQLAKRLKNSCFHDHTKLRVIGISISTKEIKHAIELIELLSGCLTSEKALKNHCPWTVVVTEKASGCYDQLKKALIKTDIRFADGFESIEFDPGRFCDRPMLELASKSDRIKKVSFSVRIVSLQNYNSLNAKQREKIASRSCWFGIKPDFVRHEEAQHTVLCGLSLKIINNIIRKVLN